METEVYIVEFKLPRQDETAILMKKGHSSPSLDRIVNRDLVPHSKNSANVHTDLGRWDSYDVLMGYVLSKKLVHKKFRDYSVDEAVVLEDSKSIIPFVGFLREFNEYAETIERASRSYVSPESNPKEYERLKNLRNTFVAYAVFYRNRMEEMKEKAGKKSQDNSKK